MIETYNFHSNSTKKYIGIETIKERDQGPSIVTPYTTLVLIAVVAEHMFDDYLQPQIF